MRAFVLPYRVLFHDTMAYGTHHFLTNLKFQCLAREHLFFSQVVEGTQAGRDLHERSIFLTREAYSLNLGPAGVGARVAILMTIEAITAVSLRFCFRVLDERGAPICAGYQTIVVVDRETERLVTGPDWLLQVGAQVPEPLTGPDFATRVHAGRTGEIFGPDVKALARAALAETLVPFDGGVLSSEDSAPPRAPQPPTLSALERVFLLPGQGSYDRPALAALLARGGETEAALRAADAVTVEVLGASLIEAIQTPDPPPDSPDFIAASDLAQVGMVLLGALSAPLLIERVGTPSAMAGHSLGEISALIAAGALSVADGTRVVCHRVGALRALGPGVGGMLAVIGPIAQSRALVASLAPLPVWANVINHDEQLVASGTFEALEALERAASDAGVPTRRLASPFPFHCPLLAPAVEAFAAAIADIRARPGAVPVYSPISGRALDPSREDLPRLLAGQLVSPLNWPDAVRSLAAAGATGFHECGGGSVLTSFVRRILVGQPVSVSAPLVARRTEKAPAAAPVQQEAPAPQEAAGPEPIAIVAMGCVLPSARDSHDLWEAVLTGRGGISDASDRDPTLRDDFYAAARPTPDKTYSLLGGFITDFRPVTAEPSAHDTSLSAVQRYLAEALAQCKRSLTFPSERTLVVVGSTADGSLDYDEALLREGLSAVCTGLPAHREALDNALVAALGARHAAPLAPFTAARQVVSAVLGEQAELMLVDAACASSLYALDAGVRALRQGLCDLALCGGIFAPGPANSCLFSQFGGLSATGSRPFDRSADGVVFGDGAAILGLMRLSEVGDRPVLALVREVGTSSDGKGPSVSVPKSDGQHLAMRRAWERAGLDPQHADYVEAHATSTPVGDSVEFSAVRRNFGPTRARPLVLGSVKALTGHTGWAAGAVSVIKVVEAISARTLPPQASYRAPNVGIDLGDSFVIPAEAQPWATREPGGTRLAGVNGFGFGGSNAHAIIEEYRPERRFPAGTHRRLDRLAVVGLGAVLPGSREDMRAGRARRIPAESLALPKGRPILPDVVEDMDRSQRLAVCAAAPALPEGWASMREDIAVVLGVEAKTERSIGINQRLYRDRVARLLAQAGAPGTAIDALISRLDEIPTSGPYTLPGLMPNVSAGRVANFFDLMGPNLVVDAGSASLLKAIEIAAQNLADGSCKLVLAGALSPVLAPELETPGAPLAELGLVLAVMDPEQAERFGVPVVAVLELAHGPRVGARPIQEEVDLRGATGALDLLDALGHAAAGRGSSWLDWSGRALRVLPAGGAPAERDAEDSLTGPAELVVHRATPVFEALPSLGSDADSGASARRLLLLVEEDLGLKSDGVRYTYISPSAVAGALTVDLSSEASAQAGLAGLDLSRFDGVVALRRARDGDVPAGDPLAELLFVVCRAAWPLLEAGGLKVGALTLAAVNAAGDPHPASGPLVGFLKALARDLPGRAVRAVTTDDADPTAGLSALAAEWNNSGPVEIIHRRGQRGALVLRELLSLSEAGPPVLRPGGLVIATGGARGVTATLVEALLRHTKCRVILLGRSQIQAVPAAVLAMDDATFLASERDFYTRRLSESPGTKIPALRREFEKLASAREAGRILARLSASGDVVYCAADLSDEAALDAALGPLLDQLGPPDLILHGAGVQFSGALVRKKLADFRAVLSTKLGGLRSLLAIAARRFPGQPPAVHALSSAFSFLGNDGQHGYGAANETLNRLAAWRGAAAGWTGIAWPGWAGVGMTRGSEYAALARSRGLRPLREEEGKRLFVEMMAGQPAAACVLLLSDGELAWAGERLRPATLASWSRSPHAHPHATEHLVEGRPTLAGAFSVERCARAVLLASPGWLLDEITGLCWDHFVRLSEDGEPLRVIGRLIWEDAAHREVEVALVSDFVHGSGRVLKRDVRHFEARFHLSRTRRPPPDLPTLSWTDPVRVPDPYTATGGPLALTGAFRSTDDLHVWAEGQSARFAPPDPPLGDEYVLPPFLIDALCRVAMIGPGLEHADRVCVPYRCARLWTTPRHSPATITGNWPVDLFASRPDSAGQEQRTGWARAEQDGAVLMWAEGLIGRFAGLAPHSTLGAETSNPLPTSI